MTDLAAQGLTVRLGRRVVLDGVTMRAPRGTFVGLVGPNGAGKTTLLRALAGLVPPDAGRVLCDGAPLAALPAEARARRIACLFQAPVVGWPMPAEEIVALGRLPHRRPWTDLGTDLGAGDRAAVERAMRTTDTLHLRGRPDTALSAGERMRVLLARALAVEAGMLLADEPVTALDPGHSLDTMALLRDLARAGTGVVAVLHDLTLAARFCDRIVVLDRGRVAADGPPGLALGDAVLHDTFGVQALRGRGPAGAYLIPWQRSAPDLAERNRR